MRERATSGDFGLPPLPTWVRNLLVALFASYVVELVLVNFLGVGLNLYDALLWYPGRTFSAPWTWVTHWLLQTVDPRHADPTGVLFSLLALYFALPTLDAVLSRRDLAQAAAIAAVSGIAVAIVGDVIGLALAAGAGWSIFAAVAFAMFGLVLPDAQVRLMFVLPVPGRAIAIGTGVLAGLLVLATRSITALEMLGAWAGVYVWWTQIRPRRSRRPPPPKGPRLQVLEGGNWRQHDQNVH